MSGGQLDTVLRHLRKLVGGPEAEDSDGRLLERFLDRRDESAFAALLARHGPMVWSVCRRLLPEPHDAEDAFQATFLVLVRRARSLERGGSLAGWLHVVAGRVALRARSGHGRQRPLTEEVPAMNATDPADEAARHELRALIDEELRRLPEKYRGAVLLCDVQGRSHEEAARQLGCPVGSMSWRLARGRELLGQRLRRRGVAPSAALLTGLLAEDAGAVVPAALTEATTRAALLVAAGGALSGPLAALVDGTVRALAPARLKLVAALLALGLLAAGAGVATHRALTAERPAPAPPDDLARTTSRPRLRRRRRRITNRSPPRRRSRRRRRRWTPRATRCRRGRWRGWARCGCASRTACPPSPSRPTASCWRPAAATTIRGCTSGTCTPASWCADCPKVASH